MMVGRMDRLMDKHESVVMFPGVTGKFSYYSFDHQVHYVQYVEYSSNKVRLRAKRVLLVKQHATKHVAFNALTAFRSYLYFSIAIPCEMTEKQTRMTFKKKQRSIFHLPFMSDLSVGHFAAASVVEYR